MRKGQFTGQPTHSPSEVDDVQRDAGLGAPLAGLALLLRQLGQLQDPDRLHLALRAHGDGVRANRGDLPLAGIVQTCTCDVYVCVCVCVCGGGG